MKPTYAELELTLHHTQTELSQSREFLKKAIEEIGKLQDEVAKLKEQLNRNSKIALNPHLVTKKQTLTLANLKRNGKEGKVRQNPYTPQKE